LCVMLVITLIARFAGAAFVAAADRSHDERIGPHERSAEAG
jgi:hypothetical protein